MCNLPDWHVPHARELTLSTCDYFQNRKNDDFSRFFELLTPKILRTRNLRKTKVVHLSNTHIFVFRRFSLTLFIRAQGVVKNHQKWRFFCDFSTFSCLFISGFTFSRIHSDKTCRGKLYEQLLAKKFFPKVNSFREIDPWSSIFVPFWRPKHPNWAHVWSSSFSQEHCTSPKLSHDVSLHIGIVLC